MTALRSSPTDTTAGPDDVQQLRDRIEELEKQLELAPANVERADTGGRSGDRLKLVTAALAGISALMAFPTMVTVRRWYRWWQL